MTLGESSPLFSLPPDISGRPTMTIKRGQSRPSLSKLEPGDTLSAFVFVQRRPPAWSASDMEPSCLRDRVARRLSDSRSVLASPSLLILQSPFYRDAADAYSTMRSLIARRLPPNMASDPRNSLSHGYRHHPQSHASQSHHGLGLGPAYQQVAPSSHQPHHTFHHHPSSRHASNGPSSVSAGTHPSSGLPMSGLPDGVGPPAGSALGNGHGHGPSVSGPGMSSAARAGKEKMDIVLSGLATANENTWMLIGWYPDTDNECGNPG